MLVLVGIVCGAAKAQRVEWGLKGGLQITQFRGDDFLGRKPNSNSLERVSTRRGSDVGYTLGGYVRSLEDIFLQGEMLISVKGAQLESAATNTKTSIQYGQLDIPLSVGYKSKKFEFTGGPLLSVQLFDNNSLKSFLSQYAATPLTFSPYRPYAFGYQAGFGISLQKITLGVRYLASIQPVSDMYIAYQVPGTTTLQDSRFQQRSSALQFTAAYRLSR